MAKSFTDFPELCLSQPRSPACKSGCQDGELSAFTFYHTGNTVHNLDAQKCFLPCYHTWPVPPTPLPEPAQPSEVLSPELHTGLLLVVSIIYSTSCKIQSYSVLLLHNFSHWTVRTIPKGEKRKVKWFDLNPLPHRYICSWLFWRFPSVSEASKFLLIYLLIVSAAEGSSWTEINTESHIENITFDRNQMDFSTVVSKEAVRTQIPTKNHTSSDAPENFTLQTKAADARGRNNFSWKTNFTTSPIGADTATALTSQSLTRGEFVPVMACFLQVCPLLENEVSASPSSPAWAPGPSKVLGCGSWAVRLGRPLWLAVIERVRNIVRMRVQILSGGLSSHVELTFCGQTESQCHWWLCHTPQSPREVPGLAQWAT